jgi:hypothetical protein
MSGRLKESDYVAAHNEMKAIAARRLELEKETALDATPTALGVMGLADPTPVSDSTNAAINFARGDYFGVLLDGISAAPNLGDFVAKPIRGVQMGLRAGGRAEAGSRCRIQERLPGLQQQVRHKNTKKRSLGKSR